jgi:hypothetical protein
MERRGADFTGGDEEVLGYPGSPTNFMDLPRKY